MANNIEQRVVQMRFDNAQFERGARTTLDTLANLENSLRFQGSQNGLASLQGVVNRFDMSSMASAVSMISDRFSTLGIIGMTVTQRITNSAIDMLGQVSNTLTSAFTQIKEGGSSRALNLEQARFMLQGLTGDLQQVEAIISGPVNDAVSGTRFGLDEAAIAASNLYASGITDMEALTHSLQAISGAATMTNREYRDMADIFATVKSNGKLMTMQLRQFSSMGMNVSAALATSLGKTEQEINEMVEKGQISYEQFADVMFKYWDLASQANTTFTGSLANVKAQLSKIGEAVYSNYYSKMIQVNVALIGYLKKLKTELAPIFEIINNGIDTVTGALAKLISNGNLLRITHSIIQGLANAFVVLQAVGTAVGKALAAVIPDHLLYNIMLAANHFYNLSVDVKTFFDSMEGQIVIIRLTNVFKGLFSIISLGINIFRGFMTAISPLITTLGAIGSAALHVASTIGRVIFQFNEGLSSSGVIDSAANSIANFLEAILPSAEAIEAFGDAVSDFIDGAADMFSEKLEALSQPLTTIKEGFTSLATTIGTVFTSIANAFTGGSTDFSSLTDFFGVLLAFPIGVLNGIANGFGFITEKLEGLRNTTSVFETIGNVFNTIKTVLGTAATAIKTAISKITDSFDLDLTLSLDSLIQLVSVIFAGKTVEKAIKFFDNIATKVGNFVKLFSGTSANLQSFGEAINKLPKKINSVLSRLADVLNEFTNTLRVGQLVLVAAAIAILAGALVIFGKTDPDRIGEAVSALSILTITMTSCFSGLAKSLDGTKGMIGAGIAMILFAESIKVLAKALAELSDIDSESMSFGITSLMLVMYAMQKFAKSLDGNNLSIKSALAAILYIAAVKLLVGVLKTLTDMVNDSGGETMAVAFGYLAGVMAAMYLFMDKVNDLSPNLKLKPILALYAYVGVLYTLIGALALLQGMALIDSATGGNSLGIAFGYLAALMASILIFVKALNEIDPELKMSAVVALGSYIAALQALVYDLAIITGLVMVNATATTIAFVLLEAMLWSLVGVVAVLNEIGAKASPQELITTIVTLAAVCLALTSLVGNLAVITALVSANANGTEIAFILLEAILWSLIGALAVLNEIKYNPQNVIPIIATLLVVVASVSVLVNDLVLLSLAVSAAGSGVVVAFVILEALLVSVIAVLYIINDMNMKAQNVATAIIALLAVTASLNVLVANLVMIRAAMGGENGAQKTVLAFVLLEAILWSLVGVLGVLSVITMNPAQIAGIIAASAALLLLAVSLAIIVPQIAILSALGPAALIGAAALVAFVGAMLLIGAVGGEAAIGLAAVGAALIVVGLGIAAIGVGLIAIGAGIAKIVTALIKLAKNADDVFEGLSKLPALLLTMITDVLTQLPRMIVDTLINLLTTVEQNLTQIVELVGSILLQILAAAQEYLPQVVEETMILLTEIIDTLAENAPMLIDSAANLIVTLCQGLAENIPQIIDAAFQLIISFIDGLATAIDENGDALRAAIVHLIESICNFIAESLTLILEKGHEIVQNIKQGISDKVDDAVTAIKNLITSVINAIPTFFGSIKSKAKTLLSKFVAGIKSKASSAKTAMTNLINKVKAAIKNKVSSFRQAGKDLVQGLINGIGDKITAAVNKAKSLGNSVVSAVQGVLDEHSPSRVFFKIGAFAVEGFILGFDSKTAAGRKAVEKFAKSINTIMTNAFKKGTLSFDIGKESVKRLNAANKQLKQYEDKLNKSQKSLAKYKDELRDVNKQLKLNYVARESNIRLSGAEKVELDYLQRKLKYNGKLTDAEMKRLGKLLGLTKKDTKELQNQLKRRNDLNKAISKTTAELKKNKQMFNELSKEIADRSVAGFGIAEKYYNSASKALQNFAKRLYQSTDDYQSNTEQINQNKSAIEALKKANSSLAKERDKYDANIQASTKRLSKMVEYGYDVVKQRQADAKTVRDLPARYKKLTKEQEKNVNSLIEIRNKLANAKTEVDTLEKLNKKIKEGNGLTKEEANYIYTLTGLRGTDLKYLNRYITNYKQKGVLTDEEIKKLQKLTGLKGIENGLDHTSIEEIDKAIEKLKNKNVLSKEEISLLKKLTDLDVKDLDKINEKIKAYEKETNRLDFLMTKLKERGDLTDEEYLEVAKIMGIKGKELKQLKAEIKYRQAEKEARQKAVDAIKENTADIKELQEANEELAEAIEDGTIQALIDFRNEIKNNLTDALKAMNTEIKDSIDLFKKFEPTDLDEGLTTNGLIANAKSFGDAYAEWGKVLGELSSKGFNETLVNRIKELGPEGLNLAKLYLQMNEEEVEQANAAILYSTRATVDQWIDDWETKQRKAAEFPKKLAELAAMGLSSGLIQEFASAGYESAGAYVEGLLASPDKIKKVNELYAESLTLPDDVADNSMVVAAAAGEGTGNAFFRALVDSVKDGLMTQEDIKNISETLSTFVETVSEAAEETADNQGGEVADEYIDGMVDGINNGSGDVTKAATNMAKDARKGTTKYLSKKNGKNIGKQMDAGLIEGLNSGSSAVTRAAVAVAQAAYNAAMESLGVHSPSRKFMELGMYADLGFALGLNAYQNRVVEASENVSNASLDAVRQAMERVSEIIDGTDDTLVITPVLDLSNVEAGAMQMKRMLDSASEDINANVSDAEAVDGNNNLGTNSYQFIQNNYSPKALSRIDIYRQTRNQFAMLRSATI